MLSQEEIDQALNNPNLHCLRQIAHVRSLLKNTALQPLHLLIVNALLEYYLPSIAQLNSWCNRKLGNTAMVLVFFERLLRANSDDLKKIIFQDTRHEDILLPLRRAFFNLHSLMVSDDILFQQFVDDDLPCYSSFVVEVKQLFNAAILTQYQAFKARYKANEIKTPIQSRIRFEEKLMTKRNTSEYRVSAAASNKGIHEIAGSANTACSQSCFSMALFTAARNADLEGAICLVGKGADVNESNPDDYATPLHAVVLSGCDKMVGFLIKQRDILVNKVTIRMETPLYYAVQRDLGAAHK